MAIDDNTSYELTGAQVKDLASKINAKADSSSLATVATSGSYNDLSDKPTIPTVNDGTLTIQQNGTTVGTFTANQSSAATVSLTDTTYSVMTGATSSTAGTSGLVPAPAAGDESKVLSGAGTWVTQSGGSTYTAGNGINISANDEISIDNSVVAELSDLPTVNDGTLTIQHNGTTKGTFTANQSSASTVNIETIYADTISPATAVDPITTGMIADGAVTSAKIDWTTLGYVHNSVNTVLAPSTSFSDRLSLTIPATGKYKCDLHCYFQCVELRQNKYGQARILVNGTVPTEEGTFVFEAFVPGSVDSYAIGSASASMALNLTQGDIVKLQVKVGSGYSEKFVNTWADLSLLRVG